MYQITTTRKIPTFRLTVENLPFYSLEIVTCLAILLTISSILKKLLTQNQDLYSTQISFSKSPQNVQIASYLKRARDFRPTWYLNNPWLQTLLIGIKENLPLAGFHFDRQVVELPDGGIVAIDWAQECKFFNSKTPILLTLHGLAGKSNSPYIETFSSAAVQKGYRVASYVMRSCGGLELKSPLLFNAGDTQEFRLVVSKVRQQFPDAPIYGIGFSLGSNILTKYVGEEGSNCPLKGFVSVCNPYNFEKLACDVPFKGKVFQAITTRMTVDLMKRHTSQLQKLEKPYNIDLKGKVFKSFALSTLDTEFTCKLRGVKNPAQWYREASCDSHIKHVTIPGFFISSLDDIACLKKALPKAEILRNKKLMLCLTQGGGHLGFFQGWKARQWHPEAILEYVEGVEKST